MVAFSLVPLSTRLAALLLRASVMTTAPSPPSNDAAVPCADGAAAPVGATREDWLAVENLSGRGDEAAEVLGGRIAPRLEAGVADARRRCEERDVGIDSLRGALAEAELLLGEFAADDAVVLTIAREPDRIEEVVRTRAQRHRRNVQAGAEPFFDALVRAITREVTHPTASENSRSEADDGAAQPSLQSVLEQIRSRNPRQAAIARRHLWILALLAASGVPARWMRAADEGSDDCREALNALIKSSFCQLSEDGSTVVLPQFRGGAVRKEWETEPSYREHVGKEVVGLLNMVDAVHIRGSQGEERRREILDCIHHLRAMAEQDYSKWLFADAELGDALARILQYAVKIGDARAALRLTDAVTRLDEMLGSDHPSTLRSRNNLAYSYQTEGRFDEAIALFERNLADHERFLGPDHDLTLSALKNLANACQEADRLDEATSLFERVLTDSIRILGPDDPGTFISRNNLAGAYQGSGRINKAIPLFQQNLTDSARALGPDHHDTVVFRNNLANAYAIAGKIDRAIPLFEQILNDHERSLGPDHPHTLASRGNLADAYREAGRLESAIDLFTKNLAYHEQILGPENPNTLSSRNNLAGSYKDAGRLEQSIELFERVLTDRERILGPDHPDTLASRSNLAGAYQEAGRIDEAIPLFERVLTDCECSLGTADPHTLAARNNLAGAYLKSGKLDQALLLFKQVLTDREQAL